ncbi:MAG: tRNA (adenosine(37)-N6)-threonylcarbamoyltransferase complex dimerization subunit type 1 TsaB [Candidatus Acidiferrales bacterium]
MAPTLTLAVDTSSRVGSLAVLRDTGIVGVVSTFSDEAYSSRMFRQLEFLLAELRVGLAEVDLFAVVSGPGSFTGLRVGLTAVKGWAEVYQRPIAAVSGLEAIASEARSSARYVAAVMDARRGEIYGALYERTAEGYAERVSECVLPAEEFFAQVFALVREQSAENEILFATPAAELVRGALSNARFSVAAVVEVSPVLAPAVGRLGIERATRGKLVNAIDLDANYIRRSDAEVARRPSESRPENAQ